MIAIGTVMVALNVLIIATLDEANPSLGALIVLLVAVGGGVAAAATMDPE